MKYIIKIEKFDCLFEICTSEIMNMYINVFFLNNVDVQCESIKFNVPLCFMVLTLIFVFLYAYIYTVFKYVISYIIQITYIIRFQKLC